MATIIPGSSGKSRANHGELTAPSFWTPIADKDIQFPAVLTDCLDISVSVLTSWEIDPGSSPTCGILSQICECLNALRVMHLHTHHHLIAPLWGLNLGRSPYSQDAQPTRKMSVIMAFGGGAPQKRAPLSLLARTSFLRRWPSPDPTAVPGH